MPTRSSARQMENDAESDRRAPAQRMASAAGLVLRAGVLVQPEAALARRTGRRLSCRITTGVAILMGLLATAQAQHHPRHPRLGAPAWHGDIRHFHEHDRHIWREGRWRHGRHDGRLGWWWVVGSAWYFYPAPVYPYPDPFLPPAVAVPPPARYWYYCEATRNYYPYVSTCPGRWTLVPATPAPAR